MVPIHHAGRSLGPDTAVDVDYSIDRFYLPIGERRAAEHDMNVRSFGVRVALGADGTPQIKALMDGAAMLSSEPLYRVCGDTNIPPAGKALAVMASL